jgi:PEP-CTERM motif-containing protein
MARMWWARPHLCASGSVLVGLAAAAVMFAGTPAMADPIVITGGDVSLPAPWTGLDPPFGWSLSGDGFALGGITFSQAGGSFVTAGDVINPSDTIDVSANPFRTGPFQQTVNGATYSGVFLSGALHFAATPGTLTSNEAAGFNTPFSMDGYVSLFQADPSNPFLPGDLLFTIPIAGHGIASVRLEPRAGMLSEMGVDYRFTKDTVVAATPEPGTVALLGSGLLVAVGRMRRQRRLTERN